MRMMTFAKRCTKEILRDPINLGFGLGFPLVLLLLLSAIQANIPVNLFEINTLTPGITVFGLSFMTLFSATLIAKDRESALLQRLYTTPLTGFDFIIGYMLPLLPTTDLLLNVIFSLSVSQTNGSPTTPQLSKHSSARNRSRHSSTILPLFIHTLKTRSASAQHATTILS